MLTTTAVFRFAMPPTEIAACAAMTLFYYGFRQFIVIPAAAGISLIAYNADNYRRFQVCHAPTEIAACAAMTLFYYGFRQFIVIPAAAGISLECL